MTRKQEKKTIEIDRRRIPLKKLLHNKEIREAAKALEDFRLGLNEQEFLYGAKIYVVMAEFGEAHAVARRLETDKEFMDRMERARIAAELKRERERKRALQAEERARNEEFRRRAAAVETIRKMARESGMSTKDLVDLLDK